MDPRNCFPDAVLSVSVALWCLQAVIKTKWDSICICVLNIVVLFFFKLFDGSNLVMALNISLINMELWVKAYGGGESVSF